MKTAVVTGASSGMGADFARELYARGYDVVLVARRQQRLEALKTELEKQTAQTPRPTVTVFPADLSREEDCRALVQATRERNVEILINNAGFGVFGEFAQTSVRRELELIDVNVRAMHLLMKLYLDEFSEKGSGYVLNVASSAGFLPGPLFSSYYASKAYMLRLSQAVAYELKRKKSRVIVSVLCPGPVDTEFNEKAGVRFALPGLSSKKVTLYALKKMFAGKTVIIPGGMMKLGRLFSKIAPDRLLCAYAYRFQSRKRPQT